MLTFSNDMDKNHDILGIHIEGNRGIVDPFGFIMAGEDPPVLCSGSGSNGGRESISLVVMVSLSRFKSISQVLSGLRRACAGS